MKNLEFNKEMIIGRLGAIERYLARLMELKKLGKSNFLRDGKDHFEIAAYNLRNALEAIFDIGAHIVTRQPGGAYDSYADIALKLGEMKIVPVNYAKDNLSNMARYRNRLTHMYLEVKPEEVFGIIQNNLGDIDLFMQYIKKLINK